jgi:prepilin-type N-terminal cleavage/methylation domain-containing protein
MSDQILWGNANRSCARATVPEKKLDTQTVKMLCTNAYIVRFSEFEGRDYRMKQLKGFTLIELLIVVAIIAILAAIAVPNFLEAQVRSKVSRAKTDMRTLATGLEAYYVDNNTYAASATNGDVGTLTTKGGFTVNSALAASATSTGGGAQHRLTFACFAGGAPFTLTTPIAYLTSIPNDPFADTKGCVFGYYDASDSGWITWSYGPDTDEKNWDGQIQAYLLASSWSGTAPATKMDYADTAGNGNTGTGSTPETMYNPYMTNPNSVLTAGTTRAADKIVSEAFTYDPTNGTSSKGDVWRVKQ